MRRTRSVLLLLGALIACHGVRTLDGDAYVLQLVDGQPLPAAYAPNPCSDLLVIADTMVFASNGVGALRSVVEFTTGAVDPVTCAGDPSAPRQRQTWALAFTYRRTGAHIEVSLECSDLASCIAPPHFTGRFENGEIVFDVSRVSRAPLVYRRLLD